MTHRRTNMLATVAVAALALVACSSQKGPATKAIADAQAALSSMQEDATKYLPGELVSAQKSLASLKDSLAKNDYAAVLAAAPALSAQLASMKEAIAARQSELEVAIAKAREEWGPLSADLPKMVESIQSRIDALSKSRRLPRGMNEGQLNGAKSGLETMKTAWGEATAAFESGDVLDAVTKAKEVKAKGAEVMAALGMSAS